MYGRWAVWRQTALSGALALLVLGTLLSAAWWRRLWSVRPLRLLGIVSYGVFLWHYQIGDGLVRYGLANLAGSPVGVFTWLLVVAVPLSVLAGLASYLVVERPFIEGHIVRALRRLRGRVGRRAVEG